MKLKIALFSLFIAFALILQACGQRMEPEESCNFVQNGALQRVSWEDGVATLYVDGSFPPEFFPAIQKAMDHWNKARGRIIFKLGGWTNQRPKPAQDSTNIIYWLSTWEAERPNEQARTTVYWSDNRITETDVRINAKNFIYSVGETGTSGKVDLESLLVHEFGHVLGLVHISGTESVMAKTLPSATLRRDPSKADLDSIRCEY